MRVRLEIDEERTAAGLVAGLFEGEYFSVFQTVESINTLSRDIALGIDDDRADKRIGRSQPNTLTRQIERALQELFVGRVVNHQGQDLERNRTSEISIFGPRPLLIPRRKGAIGIIFKISHGCATSPAGIAS
jgi:hypothetical protein